MFAILTAVLRVLLTDPIPASVAGAWAAGHPELAHVLVRTTRRESRGRLVGPHARDAHHSRSAHRKALAVGWLDDSCHHHQRSHGGWASRGPHGQFAAYSLRYLPGCWPAWVLDIPIVSAVAAARRMAAACDRYGACRRQDLRLIWSGWSVYRRGGKLRDLQ